MAGINVHLRKIHEHLEELKDAIAIGIEKRPATIGMHVSACSIELLELYLHKKGKIPLGKIIKHEWFKRPKPNQKVKPLAERKLPFNFPKKKEIFELLYDIEEIRNKLIYGNPTRTEIKAMLNAFNRLKEILTELLENEGVEIEG